jgi:hypothetical protein
VIAPVLVGDPAAPRMTGVSGTGVSGTGRRLHLAEARMISGVVLLRYLPGPTSGT